MDEKLNEGPSSQENEQTGVPRIKFDNLKI